MTWGIVGGYAPALTVHVGVGKVMQPLSQAHSRQHWELELEQDYTSQNQ